MPNGYKTINETFVADAGAYGLTDEAAEIEEEGKLAV